MIFLAVGTQLPFDRLTQAVDRWATRERQADIYGQIGQTNYKPESICAERYLSPEAFTNYCRRASLLIAHAGMGLIISALEMKKPIIVMPRRAALGEHRNEHQLATVTRFMNTKGIYVALDVTELDGLLARHRDLEGGDAISEVASPDLLEALRTFIAKG